MFTFTYCFFICHTLFENHLIYLPLRLYFILAYLLILYQFSLFLIFFFLLLIFYNCHSFFRVRFFLFISPSLTFYPCPSVFLPFLFCSQFFFPLSFALLFLSHFLSLFLCLFFTFLRYSFVFFLYLSLNRGETDKVSICRIKSKPV